MGQQLFTDKIGTLTHSAGNITMAASPSSPAYLTIGGRQYTVTSNLVVALPTLTAAARYQVYSVVSGGVPILVISQNENSVGPSGYSSWKLVGSLMANGLASVGFGSFLTIEGAPITLNEIDYLPIFANLGTVSVGEAKFSRIGDRLSAHNRFTIGTPVAAAGTMTLPGSLTPPVSFLIKPVGSATTQAFASYPFRATVLPTGGLNTLGFGIPSASLSLAFGNSVFTASDLVGCVFELSISGWTSTPIKDL